MPAISYRDELDEVRCEECGKAHAIYLDPTCHPESTAVAVYEKGELRLECAECDEPFLRVLVAG